MNYGSSPLNVGEAKICIHCNQIKLKEEFYKTRNACKTCCRKKAQIYREEYKEKCKEYGKAYYANNKEKFKITSKKYYNNNKEKIIENNKQYRENNKNTIIEIKKRYYCKNKEDINKKRKECRKNNKEYISNDRKKFARTTKGITQKLLSHAKGRARKHNIPINIGINFLQNIVEQNSYCPVTKEKFVVGNRTCKPNSRTIDRIYPEKGYIEENILIVSHKANTVKNSNSFYDLINIVSYIENFDLIKTLSWKDKFYKMKLTEWTQYPKNKWGHDYRLNLIRHAKERAVKNNLDFCLLKTDIIIPNVYPVLGTLLIKGNKKVCINSPSIDRIDSTKGYTRNNIQIISHKANASKSNCTMDSWKTFCKRWIEIIKRNEYQYQIK